MLTFFKSTSNSTNLAEDLERSLREFNSIINKLKNIEESINNSIDNNNNTIKELVKENEELVKTKSKSSNIIANLNKLLSNE